MRAVFHHYKKYDNQLVDPSLIPTAVIAGISKKISEESCEFNSYK
jgi:hypothetical protein